MCHSAAVQQSHCLIIFLCHFIRAAGDNRILRLTNYSTHTRKMRTRAAQKRSQDNPGGNYQRMEIALLAVKSLMSAHRDAKVHTHTTFYNKMRGYRCLAERYNQASDRYIWWYGGHWWKKRASLLTFCLGKFATQEFAASSKKLGWQTKISNSARSWQNQSLVFLAQGKATVSNIRLSLRCFLKQLIHLTAFFLFHDLKSASLAYILNLNYAL